MSSKKLVTGVLVSSSAMPTNLGVMQTNLENAAKRLKNAQAKLQAAQQEHIEAEVEYDQANKSLLNGVATLREATKIKV